MCLLFYVTLNYYCDWEQVMKEIRRKMNDDGNEQKIAVKNELAKENLL